jgi:cytochrome c oxidase subunit III
MIASTPTTRGGSEGGGSLSHQLTGFTSPIIWGVLLLVAIETTLLALFVASYFYLWLGASHWPPPGVTAPDLVWPTVSQLLLVMSPLPAWLGYRALVQGKVRPLLVGVPLGLLLAGGYLVLKAGEYARRDYRWNAHAYGSLDWTMGGYAALHVMALLLAGSFVWLLALRGHFHRERYTGVQALLIYWLFVSLGSLLFFGVQYMAGRW